MAVFATSVMVLVMLLLGLAVPVGLGVYVYQDAKARGMEPLAWALIAALAPSFIGLIIYLVARRDYEILSCPNCGCRVTESYGTCPQCGQKLRASCENCGTLLRPEWKLCPQCGREMEQTQTFAQPVVGRGAGNKKLMVIVAAILLIPVILAAGVVVAFMGLRAYTHSDSVSESDVITEAVLDDHLTAQIFRDMTDYREYDVIPLDKADLGKDAKKWVRQCRKGEKGIYARTYSKNQTGDYGDVRGSGMYDITYDYTVVVIHDDEPYDFTSGGFSHYGDEEFLITEEISQTFIRLASSEDRKQVKEYGNVFVLRFPSAYDIDFTYANGYSSTMTAKRVSESLELVLTDKAGSETFSYTVPFDKDFYSPLGQEKDRVAE
ncbi:MAG: zinc ribbon domain-containing protein [Clostridia bacterium]|nr:zinc ribbon domain-containing protein [Clostridia bacterium]MBQ1554116.1 zinc ribbon domain-containing protein [Clostridia bacterium]